MTTTSILIALAFIAGFVLGGAIVAWTIDLPEKSE